MNAIREYWAVLQGRKTYLISALTIAWALYGYYKGLIDSEHATNLVLGALGLSALRNGVQKVQDSL